MTEKLVFSLSTTYTRVHLVSDRTCQIRSLIIYCDNQLVISILLIRAIFVGRDSDKILPNGIYKGVKIASQK